MPFIAKLFSHNGITDTLDGWEQRTSIKRSTLASRYYCLGWDFSKCVETVKGVFNERRGEKHAQEKHCHTSTYYSWGSMKTRCTNSNNIKFKSYGGRGITVCDEWMYYENFYKDMGDKPEGTSIDRIDNNKGYYKENCRWATDLVQANNKRNNLYIEHNGESLTIKQWADKLGIKRSTLSMRYYTGKGGIEKIFRINNKQTII